MKRIIWVLLISFLFLNATGSSFAEIKLTPIATHENGEVLFQTYSNINGMGAHNNSYIKIGWLVVSSAGVWDEEVALFGYEGENQKKWKQVDTQISAYREGKINLKSPGSVLKKLMLKYNFTKETPLIYEKNKILELKPK